MLVAYPPEFRREYGPHMAQVFRDCYRAERQAKSRLGIGRLWVHTFIDLVRTAPSEHWDNLRKDNWIMNKLRKNGIAILVTLGIIIGAFFLLSYGRRNEVSWILTVGYVLDALVTAGVIGNLIVFLLIMVTRFNPLRIALWTLLVVNGLLLILSAVTGSRVDPQFKLATVLVGYVVSFVFWFGLHWMWAQRQSSLPAAT
jgi:hypothetical protein